MKTMVTKVEIKLTDGNYLTIERASKVDLSVQGWITIIKTSGEVTIVPLSRIDIIVCDPMREIET